MLLWRWVKGTLPAAELVDYVHRKTGGDQDLEPKKEVEKNDKEEKKGGDGEEEKNSDEGAEKKREDVGKQEDVAAMA
ncbi:hypothetical protein L6452_40021 [Arctium lappa]|uniref:Uncharacterized protein n=1 Tax=Arctium lappa TaxID=4217 RepID=A0ACB8XUM7_ARCLA|nr:hypothetical protein L6452_40021 [Arctium lappa]